MSNTSDNRSNEHPVTHDALVESGISFEGIDESELDAIMDRLRVIAGDIDSPPSIVAELARAAFETRDLDAQLAVLTADSEFDVLELVRSVATEPRMISFETESITVELQLERNDDTLTIRGLVVGVVGEIILDTGDRKTPTQLDDRGWFLVEGVTAGALRLRMRGADGGNVTTEWITT